MRRFLCVSIRNICESATCKVPLFVFLLLPAVLNAQKINFSLNADRSEALIGEHVNIFIEASADRKTTLIWPLFTDTIGGGLSVLMIGAVDSVKFPDGIIHYKMQLIVTAYDSGTYCLNNLRMGYSSEGQDLSSYVKADSVILRFNLMEIDEGASIRDIKNILNLPFSWRDLMPWFLMLAAIVLLVIVVKRVLLNRKKKPGDYEQLNDTTQRKQPWEIALEELEALRKSDLLWVTGVKAYYISLSEIVRVYIRDGLGPNAPELTTRETLQSLNGHISVAHEQKEQLAMVLFLSDMVKFARYNPSEQENGKVMEQAVAFVAATAPDHLSKKNAEEVP